MRNTIAFVLVVGTVLATASPSHSQLVGCQQSHEPVRGVASATVVLSRVSSRLAELSAAKVELVLQSNRRLRFKDTEVTIFSGNPNPYELALVAGDATLTSGPACSGLPLLVTKPLRPTVLAQLFGLGGAARPQVVLRDQGGTSPLLAGTLGEINVDRLGCARVCAPALAAACRTSCEGQQPLGLGRCMRECRRAGLRACRETGSCHLE